MSVRRGRLRRIETALTPTQAAVLWLQEAHRFESMQAYVEWLAGQPFTAYPLHRLRDLVVPAVEQAMKGADREACDQAIRAAVREVAFLFFVHQQANARILSDWRAWHFGVALLTHDPAQAGGAAPQGQERDLRHEQWREHAANTLRELCALTEAMRVLGDRYFGGHAVPFPQAAEGLAFCVGTAERLIENHNDDMRFAGRRKSRARLTDELIDVKAITAGAPAVATLPVTEIVALAKSEVHSLMGEQDAAADAVLPLGRARQRMKRHLGGRRAVSRGYGWPCRARRPPVPHAHYSPIVR